MCIRESGHAAWALGQIANPEAIKALEQSYEDETDQYVRSELTAALDIVALKKHL